MGWSKIPDYFTDPRQQTVRQGGVAQQGPGTDAVGVRSFLGLPWPASSPATVIARYWYTLREGRCYRYAMHSSSVHHSMSSWGTTRQLLDRMGPGVPIAASFSRVAYNLLIDPCAWCRCGGSSRLAAGHAPTLREGGQRGLPVTAASLAFAGGCSRLLLSAFAYTVSPTPVCCRIQALRKYARHGGGADGMWYR